MSATHLMRPLKNFLGHLLMVPACLLLAALIGNPAGAQSVTNTASPFDAQPVASGPVRLRQPTAEVPATAAAPAASPTAPAGEFEAFAGLPRFGADMVNELSGGAGDFNPVIPPEYVIQSGDEVLVTLWGSIDADLRLVVDRSGRVSIPRVGPVLVAGIRYADLQSVLEQRAARVFKNFELAASLGRLRGVRVYVTGYVQRPGAYAVAGLSTLANAVMRAGGPAASGSFRAIELRRGGKVVVALDLYDLLLRGDRGADRLVQPDDVIHVPAIGTQVALKGSVNKPAVYELKPGERLRDLLTMAAGFSPVADRTRVALERLDARNTTRIEQIALPNSDSMALTNGDVVRVFSAVTSVLSVKRQNKRVRIEGEVAVPGEYVLPPESTLADALKAAGGLSSTAYPYAAQFTRESVRQTQQENFDRALNELETSATRTSMSNRVSTADDAAAQEASMRAATRLIDRMRSVRPNGRIVLQLAIDSRELPDLPLEDGDRLYVPTRPTSVGVFGSVFNAGSFLFADGRGVGDYLQQAGGPTRNADEPSTFLVRANGSVVSALQTGNWFNKLGNLKALPAEPGDTIFVPEEMDRSTALQTARDWTQIFFQLAVGLAGLKTATGF